jgi:hypothetical protein
MLWESFSEERPFEMLKTLAAHKENWRDVSILKPSKQCRWALQVCDLFWGAAVETVEEKLEVLENETTSPL